MPMNREGFTVVELLIVLVIIGILAAVAVPKYDAAREEAHVSTMQEDLRALQTAQTRYYEDLGSGLSYWTGELMPGMPEPALDFEASAGVTIVVSSEDAAVGYRARASHAETERTCSMVLWEAPPAMIRCTDRRR
ncbi:MAG: prepilin-type N-terminal cleavage/methylation domain-containing protein [Gemmatimonadetes bacterium]|nr:prepilin-type N-terminal cleavage/methylation domain-containing protein [Gemmatimonadota bacterium]NIQ52246.1 prepilin-type N-terminal cleavage/methylation domain-containing protein [Gemmatimonadota bacterium]NIU72346.1 prepilin-type N-terminal cleavage/methylation domain-containing protein [Gammaproteobacteria bacterium]NIX42835.1 prepilin-type N-terminal cleavage/methylation domain-containing protein [Gemmatimonadota bacterium]NIY07005.1 prepilin-type N-terminal cleavage/methylation domain